jgi:hypothetical protein
LKCCAGAIKTKAKTIIELVQLATKARACATGEE